MIRKYLNGSEPTLSRANQIARQANCSLEWLATGQGFQYRQAEVVDMPALEEALMLALEQLDADTPLSNEKALKLLVALYQYLRTTKRAVAVLIWRRPAILPVICTGCVASCKTGLGQGRLRPARADKNNLALLRMFRVRQPYPLLLSAKRI